jgi:hypothetical protein
MINVQCTALLPSSGGEYRPQDGRFTAVDLLERLTLAEVVKRKSDHLIFMTNNRRVPVKNTFSQTAGVSSAVKLRPVFSVSVCGYSHVYI